ncbi:unannotated protein [freshwater metagenome]|uniref:Unannotated protein n=1 Tax=freshwater metagenome TaxID=449393 RepID=A0A6J7PH98_9ZZZZ
MLIEPERLLIDRVHDDESASGEVRGSRHRLQRVEQQVGAVSAPMQVAAERQLRDEVPGYRPGVSPANFSGKSSWSNVGRHDRVVADNDPRHRLAPDRYAHHPCLVCTTGLGLEPVVKCGLARLKQVEVMVVAQAFGDVDDYRFTYGRSRLARRTSSGIGCAGRSSAANSSSN